MLSNIKDLAVETSTFWYKFDFTFQLMNNGSLHRMQARVTSPGQLEGRHDTLCSFL